ncbi:MAG: phenylpyruvate tautomerase MIF-related protein [Pseudomonadota bacterium]
MPMLKVHTSATIDEATTTTLLTELSRIVAQTIGKPETYVMTIVDQAPMCMAGEVGPAAFGDLRSIGGLTPAVNRSLSEQISELLHARLGLATSRVFLNFTEVDGSSWGHDGGTFG